MQPDGQSPQPTRIVTRNAPTPDAGFTSYQLDWPIMSGSFSVIPANRGSKATTAATACSVVVTGPPARLGAGEADGATEAEGTGELPAPPAPLHAAIARTHANSVATRGRGTRAARSIATVTNTSRLQFRSSPC